MQKIGVIGAGTMGHGIAQVFAMNGCDVTLVDVNEAVLQKAVGKVLGSVRKFAEKKGADPAAAAAEVEKRIVVTTDLERLRDADLVVEAAVEDERIKRELRLEGCELLPSWREIAVEIEPNLPDRDDPGRSRQQPELVGDGARPVLRVVRMDRKRRVDIGLAARELHGGAAGCEVGADGDARDHAGLACPVEHHIAIVAVFPLVDVVVRVDKPHRPRRASSSSTTDGSSLRKRGCGSARGCPGSRGCQCQPPDSIVPSPPR